MKTIRNLITLLLLAFAFSAQAGNLRSENVFRVAETDGSFVADGSRWWDGIRLYTADVASDGSVHMRGESMTMGGSQFMLKRTEGTEEAYSLAYAPGSGYFSIRGKLGWRVDCVSQSGLKILAVRKPGGDCCYTFVETRENLKDCTKWEDAIDNKDVSWVMQNYPFNTRYLGRFSKSQLRILRNEILARHGWRFHTKELEDYFGRQEWYKPLASNKDVRISPVEEINLQMVRSDEAAPDGDRVRYENAVEDPAMRENAGVIVVHDEEQFLNALGNDREVVIAAGTHLNLSCVLEQEEKFSGVPGRVWVTVAEQDDTDVPVIISEYCTDGQQLTLRNFHNLTIRGQSDASIEVNPRYAFCLNFIDCVNCKVLNLTHRTHRRRLLRRWRHWLQGRLREQYLRLRPLRLRHLWPCCQ